MRVRISVLCATVGLVCATGVTALVASPTSGRTVPCRENIGGTRFPYGGSIFSRYRYRLVLGAVAVPPAYLEQVVPTGEKPWTYWRKAGLVVRADGQAVSIRVPSGWRGRASITWGNGGNGVFDSLRIAGCSGGAARGLSYAGGFYLRSPSACLPLVFGVGRRTEMVRFGIGRHC